MPNHPESSDEEMGSQNHSLIQARLTGLLLQESRFNVATELSLDISQANLAHLKLRELKPDICLYPVEDFDFIDCLEEDDVLQVTKMPVLAVEILSPTQSESELLAKLGSTLL